MIPLRLFLFCSLATVALGLGRLSAAEGNADAKARTPLLPELETKLAEFLKKAREAKGKIWAAQSRQQIEQVVSVTGLSPEGAKALERPAQQAVEASLDVWAVKAEEGWRGWAQQLPVQTPEVFDQVLSQVDQSVKTDWFGDYKRPFEQPVWEEGLRAALTPGQWTQWNEKEKERRAAIAKEIDGIFNATVERTREQQRVAFEKKGDVIKKALQLPAERAAKLDALAVELANVSNAQWRERAERMLLWTDEEQRQAMLKGGNFYLRPDPEDAIARQKAWDDGVEKFLSPEELGRWRTSHRVGKERRALALARILLAQLDERIAFTTMQRERLRPLAERVIAANPALVPESLDENSSRINFQTLIASGRTLEENELARILDETQRKRWMEVCSGKDSAARSGLTVTHVLAPAAGSAAGTSPRASEPEDLEHAISDHLHERATAERKRLLAIHLLKAEDAARIGQLSASATSQLAIAARGAAEEELAAWKARVDQSIRSQLRDVTPENVRQRLAGMDRYVSSRSNTNASDAGSLWETTVAYELNAAQQTAWKKEVEAREAFRDEAIAALIMAQFDRTVFLSNEQWGKLAPRVSKMVRDYSPDIGSMFSSAYGNTWYLQSYSLFIPLAAIPEAEFKGILTAEQWTRWSSSAEFGNLANYWENVQRIHASRMKQKSQ